MNALVFLANENYAEYVKQMVFSARRYGHWEDDIVLLKWGAFDTSWFEQRGVMVEDVSSADFNFGNLPDQQAVYFAKIILFHPKFSRWKKMVYLDTDMLIRRDIRHLLSYEGFAAADDCFRYPVIHQMTPINGDWSKSKVNGILSKKALRAAGFNSGLMVVPTVSNTIVTFNKLCELTAEYWQESAYFDQGILNMHLNPIRKRIPYVFNDYYLSEDFNRRGLIRRFSDRYSVILHIIHPSKPWNKDNPYHREWKARMQKADESTEYPISSIPPSKIGTFLVDFVNRWNIAGITLKGWWIDRYRGFKWLLRRMFVKKSHQS